MPLDPGTASIIAGIIRGGIELWANHAGKEPGWTPSESELQDIIDLNEKTPAAFYREAAERLGVKYTPPEDPPPE